MKLFCLNQNVGALLMDFLLLTYINIVSSEIHTHGNIENDDLLKVPMGDVCPEPEDVMPCRCSHSNLKFITMDCTDIENEEELKEVFSIDFPVKDMYLLRIICKGNNTVKSLKSGDLGSVSFEQILIADCGMTTVEEAALENSYSTLELLSLQENQLTSIPDLSKFEVLKNLFLVDNAIEEFPNISSKSLVDVNLSGNKFRTIPREAILQMPALKEMNLYDLNLTDIPVGTFTGNENLTSLSLSNNMLQVWSHDVVKLQGNYTYLYLSNNRIAEVNPGSLTGVKNILDLRHNSLTELKEDVFKSPLEDGVEIMLEDNPFGCGCDIKWLILNETLLERFYVTPECADGTSFLDLDPTYYEENC